MFWFPRSRRVGKKPPPPPFFSTTTKRKEKARGALTHDHHAPPPPPLKEASPCLLAMRTTRFESCRQCLSFLSRRRDVFVSWEKSKKKKPKTLNYLSLHREGNIFLCVFFKTTTPFFFWTRRETLQTKHLSLCLVIYIKTLCCAFVRRAFAETNKERERKKKMRLIAHTHTHSLSRRKRRRRRRRRFCVFEF